jgi:urea transport system permease protein
VLPNLVILPWNRIIIVGFAMFVLFLVVAADEQDTPRPVRPCRHAEPQLWPAAVGVPTSRIDMHRLRPWAPASPGWAVSR